MTIRKIKRPLIEITVMAFSMTCLSCGSSADVAIVNDTGNTYTGIKIGERNKPDSLDVDAEFGTLAPGQKSEYKTVETGRRVIVYEISGSPSIDGDSGTAEIQKCKQVLYLSNHHTQCD
jgi:hypothetical protein